MPTAVEDKAITAAAKTDPDAQPLTPKQLKSMNRKVEVTSQRTVHTYSEMWHAGHCLFEMQKEVQAGSRHLLMGSLVFTAFAMEAYLNHAGAKIFTCWGDLEYLGPTEKLNVISEKFGIKVDYDRRPLANDESSVQIP